MCFRFYGDGMDPGVDPRHLWVKSGIGIRCIIVG